MPRDVIVERLLALLAPSYPTVSRAELETAVQVASQVLLVVLARLPWRHSAGQDVAEESQRLIEFVGGGLDYRYRRLGESQPGDDESLESELRG